MVLRAKNQLILVKIIDLGSCTNHGDMSTSLIKPTYLVKLSTKGEGGQDSRKSKKWSTWFVYDPYTSLVPQKSSVESSINDGIQQKSTFRYLRKNFIQQYKNLLHSWLPSVLNWMQISSPGFLSTIAPTIVSYVLEHFNLTYNTRLLLGSFSFQIRKAVNFSGSENSIVKEKSWNYCCLVK